MTSQLKDTLEILVEEKSMAVFLKRLLPRILPGNWVLDQNCFIRTHNGKHHLQDSIPRKAKAYRFFPSPVRLLIIHDQDSHDCIDLKAELKRLVRDENQQIPLLIRIACRELENWYLGDFKAISQVYPEVKSKQYINKAPFRNPDKREGAKEMKRLSKDFRKTACAGKMGALINVQNNKSPSFDCFVKGVQGFCL